MKIKHVAVGVGLVALLSSPWTAPHMVRHTYQVTVTDKERVVDHDHSKYLIFAKLQNGKERVFEDVDSPLELKFNSSDVYGQLERGGAYEVKTIGWRFPLFSKYENIMHVRKR